MFTSRQFVVSLILRKVFIIQVKVFSSFYVNSDKDDCLPVYKAWWNLAIVHCYHNPPPGL